MNIEDRHIKFSIESDEINHALQKLTQYGVINLNSNPPTPEE